MITGSPSTQIKDAKYRKAVAVIDEIASAYKPKPQRDLVEVVYTLRQLAYVKG
ncbi:hypothetical protein Acal02_00912 [Acinetobacter calcoaceticus]